MAGDIPGLHPQIQSLVREAESDDDDAFLPDGADLAAVREGYLRTALELGGALEPVAEVRDVVFPRPDGGSVPAQAYAPQHGEPRGTVVWFHGGGWCLGDLPGIERVCRALANATGAWCASVDYRLAPEHPFPAALEDARAAVRWAAQDPFGAGGPLVVGGDSAGGNLAIGAARHLPGPIDLLALVYPATDARMGSRSYRDHDIKALLSRNSMASCYAAYGGDPTDPDVSPLLAEDLDRLPATVLITAGIDVLADDGDRFAERLAGAGVPVDHRRFDDMAHGFLRWGGLVDRAREALGIIGAAVRDRD